MKYGAVDYIPKPFKPDEILAVVNDVIKNNNRPGYDGKELKEIKKHVEIT